MKKILAILLALCIFLTSTAIADTTDPIVFHGIPWGISIDEVAAILKDKGIPIDADEFYLDADMQLWTYDFGDNWQYTTEKTGHRIVSTFWYDDVKIAGYNIRSIEIYAHYDITDDVLKKETGNSKYYMASIWFDISDELAMPAYSDLSEKLSALYGTGAEDTVSSRTMEYTYTVWYGANDTAACLYRSEGEEYQFVNLMYGHKNIEETLQKVRQMVINSQVQSIENDITGL